MSFRNILLVGASGDLGTPTLNALLQDPTFNVSVLARKESKATFPPSVTVHRADFTSHSSLVAALKGQDAVVSTLGGSSAAYLSQIPIIDAAIEAGVKRFLASEFGVDTDVDGLSPLVWGDKFKVRDHLLENKDKITYTRIFTGSFLDWSLRNAFLGVDVQNKTATFYDGGVNKFSATSLQTIANSIVAVLRHPAETENRTLRVHDVAISQLDLIHAVEEVTGSKIQIVEKQSVAEREKFAHEAVAKGDFGAAAVAFIQVAFFGDKGISLFEGKDDNGLLELKTVGLRDIVAGAVKSEREQ